MGNPSLGGIRPSQMTDILITQINWKETALQWPEVKHQGTNKDRTESARTKLGRIWHTKWGYLSSITGPQLSNTVWQATSIKNIIIILKKQLWKELVSKPNVQTQLLHSKHTMN